MIGLKPGETMTEIEIIVSQGYIWPDHPYWYLYYDYPQWTYEMFYANGIIYFEQADPVNLGWKYTSEQEVNSWLTQHGWNNQGWAANNWIYDPSYGWTPQNHHVFKDHPSPYLDRYHVRLWQLSNGRVCGQAHIDTNPPHHAVLYESAEFTCAYTFYGYNSWIVRWDSYCLNNYLTGYYNGWSRYNDGYATQVEKL